MDRRDFIRKGLGASAAIGSYLMGFEHQPLLARQSPPYDLVAVKGGLPEVMFDKGIDALGGIASYVQRGQKVVIKPNIGWDVPPERAGNTNPALVTRIIEHCKNAGAKEVTVLDHTCDNWQRCYSNSGIEDAVKRAGGRMAPAHSESYYQEVAIPEGSTLLTAKEHEAILAADVFINVPILKNHGGATLTIAMKNLMGNVWDRRFWHGTDLHQCIADFASYRKPDLNIVDAYLVMKINGPRGVSVSDVVTMKAQLLSSNMVTADAAAAKLFGIDPMEVRYLRLAAEKKLGTLDLSTLHIKRITV